MLKHNQIVEDLKFLAEIYGWTFQFHKSKYSELYFRRGGCGLTIWYTKMTVRTAMTHPRMGTTQMYRKRVDMALMEALFSNPRTHTNKGYIKKAQTNKKNWRRTNNTDLYQLRQRYISPKKKK